MRDSVPSASYSSICNVLHLWSISLIPTYRVYRLYDKEYNVSLLFAYRTRRHFRGGLIFVLFAGEVDPRKLMRTKIKNYGPSP